MRIRGDFTIKWVIACALIASAQIAVGKPIGIVTILEGKATVIRGLSEFDPVEGVRLNADDLVKTDKDTFLRIEYEDETWLELGPETVLQLSHPADKKGKRPGLYLMSGWLKIGCGKPHAGAAPALAAVGMDIVDLSGVIVLRAREESHEIFAEAGAARWIDRMPHGSAPVSLNNNFLVVAHGRPPTVQGRPTSDFTSALPRAYRDTLPFRYSLFAARAVAVKDERTFSYAEVEPWLDAEPTVRRQFLVLWRRKAYDPAFRASLDHDLNMHPEWDPILHPEKYEVTPPTQTPATITNHAPVAAPVPQTASPIKNNTGISLRGAN